MFRARSGQLAEFEMPKIMDKIFVFSDRIIGDKDIDDIHPNPQIPAPLAALRVPDLAQSYDAFMTNVTVAQLSPADFTPRAL